MLFATVRGRRDRQGDVLLQDPKQASGSDQVDEWDDRDEVEKWLQFAAGDRRR